MLLELGKKEVLVGFPDTTAQRKEEDGSPSEITNAALGYIHDTGMPEQNIPARPFMIPGMDNAEAAVTRHLVSAARAVLQRRGVDAINKGFERAGVSAMGAIKRKINEGVPPPLSEWTLRERAARGDEGSMWELAWRAAGAPASTELAKPLIDTGQLRNAVNYVVRARKKRRR